MAVGIVPMGGSAERWAPLVTPKELLPFGIDRSGRPRVAADTVLDAMAAADVSLVVVPILPDKVPLVMRYLGTRLTNGALIAYVAAAGPTLVANLALCAPLVRDQPVLFGMPDTYFTPVDILARCRDRLNGQIELALGIFPSDEPEELDVVDHHAGEATRVRPKPRPEGSPTGDVWGVAAWAPRFTDRLCAWPVGALDPPGVIFQEVIADAPGACAVEMGDDYVDLGSYARYRRALSNLDAVAMQFA